MSVHAVPKHWSQSSQKERSRLRRTRVWLNGKEVTTDCFYADPRRGVVRLFVRDANGHVMIDRQRDEAQKQELRGRVRVQVRR